MALSSSPQVPIHRSRVKRGPGRPPRGGATATGLRQARIKRRLPVGGGGQRLLRSRALGGARIPVSRAQRAATGGLEM